MALSNFSLELYVVIETSMLKVPLREFVLMAVSAGASALQLRDKGSTGVSMAENALIIKDTLSSLKESRPLFIINDRADIAAACGGDGVHLGVKDTPIELVKKAFPNLILGYSCNGEADALKASQYAHYAGVGPAFHTLTKTDLRPVLGVNGIRQVVKSLSVPSVAIGGINDGNAFDLLQSGVSGLALSSYVCSAINPYEALLAIKRAAYG